MIVESWLAHRVRRYHANPHLVTVNQSNADHAHGVAAIVASLFPGAGRDLLVAAIFHDAGEGEAGDPPGTAKRANPALAAAHKVVEERARDRVAPPFDLSETEADQLKLADQLEAVLFVAFHRPGLLQRDDWASYCADMIGRADRLGVYTPVAEAVERMQDIGWA